MNNTFELEFDKATTRLAGFPYGESEFDNQVGENIDYLADKIIVVFPKQIEKVASSFVQGFFAKIVQNIGYEGFDRQVIIRAGSEKLEEDIRSKIH